jgi:hypothetical protein
MDKAIPCPRCGARLRQPEHADPEAISWSCPRCLAAVASPEDRSLPAGVTQQPGLIDTPRHVDEGEPCCPACANAVQTTWISCPHCGQSLREQLQRADFRGPEADIRLDQQGIGLGTMLLASLGGLTLCWLLANGGAMAVRSPDLLLGAVPPLIFLLIVFLFFFLRQPLAERSGGQAAVRTLATVGTMVVALFAVLILLFSVCYVTKVGKF